MDPEVIEHFAIRAALGNNGGSWADHYTEAQKDFWRQFARDIAHEISLVATCMQHQEIQHRG
jgi:hypothetical protein